MAWMLLLLLAAASKVVGQDAQPVDILPDPPVVEAVGPAPIPYERPISWPRLFPNIAQDQKNIWLFPLKLRHKNILIPTAAVVATTAALIALDPRDTPYFRRTADFHGFDHIFTGRVMAVGTMSAPAAMYLTGLRRRDSKMQNTALLAAEALADVEILSIPMKDIARRERPSAIPPNGNFSNSWFEDNHHPGFSDGSFPSGHTIGAFAVATVSARRYRNHRWVPYAAYGLATLVGFSRLTLSAHFPSDVFVGAVLGYSVSRFAVLRE